MPWQTRDEQMEFNGTDEAKDEQASDGSRQSPEASLYRLEIKTLLQDRDDMGLEKLSLAELESLLAGLLGALEQARGTSLGLLDTMPSLSTLRAAPLPLKDILHGLPRGHLANWVRQNCGGLRERTRLSR